MKNLKSLKKILKLSFDYYLINTSDEFLNEYVSESASMLLKWLTGFTGSNGMALIGKNNQFFLLMEDTRNKQKNELDSFICNF